MGKAALSKKELMKFHSITFVLVDYEKLESVDGTASELHFEGSEIALYAVTEYFKKCFERDKNVR